MLLRALQLALAFAPCALFLGCASGPSIVTSTPNDIAIEFPNDSTVSSAAVLAQKECTRYGKVADFDIVEATASPKTRVAKFKCVSSSETENRTTGVEPAD